MSRDPPWSRAPYAVFGYLAAVLVAVTATLATMLLWAAEWDLPSWASFYAFLRHLGELYGFGIMVTLPTALPGFLVTLLVAHYGGWTGWLPYAAAGTLDAILALIFFGVFVHQDVFELEVVLPCLPGGFFGGCAYWVVAGRAASP